MVQHHLIFLKNAQLWSLKQNNPNMLSISQKTLDIIQGPILAKSCEKTD